MDDHPIGADKQGFPFPLAEPAYCPPNVFAFSSASSEVCEAGWRHWLHLGAFSCAQLWSVRVAGVVADFRPTA